MSRRVPIVPLTDAQRERVESNLGLVGKIASAMLGRRRRRWVPRERLESDGRMGLIRAAQRFDPANGAKFETFAARHIRGAILDGMRAESFIRTRGLRERGERVPEFGPLDPAMELAARADCTDDQRDAVRYHTRDLPPRNRRVMELYYADEMNMKDIAALMKWSESRVSQVHSESIRHLRERDA
jgi:RNA polymerase sigma factor for flagellar operon FliA